MSLVGFSGQNHPQQTGKRGPRLEVDNLETPSEFFTPLNERFGFTLDVAALPHNAKCERYFTPIEDGLKKPWIDERVWCNPPYSNIEPWVKKAWAESGSAPLIVMLLPANRTEQGWWQRHVEQQRREDLLRVEFLAGRLRDFVHPDTGEVFVPKEDLENCEAELRKARRRIKAYERGKEKERESYRERSKVIAAITYWAELSDHARVNINAADRFDLVVARRKEGYPFGDPVEEAPSKPCPTICLAIEGITAYPWVGPEGRQSHNGGGSKRFDRLGICLGGGEALERFARLGWRWRMNGGTNGRA